MTTASWWSDARTWQRWRQKAKSATPTRKPNENCSLPARSGSTCTTCASRWRRPASSILTSRRQTEMAMRLRTLLGDHPGTAALKNGSIRSDLVSLDFADYSPTHKGFKPMVREQAFDVSEMAIVTYLMARSFAKPMVLLPLVVVARSPHGFTLHNAKRGTLAPADLNGKRVGIRSFT